MILQRITIRSHLFEATSRRRYLEDVNDRTCFGTSISFDISETRPWNLTTFGSLVYVFRDKEAASSFDRWVVLNEEEA